MSDWSAKNPYMTQITENYILNGEGSKKETRHIVFALGDSGLDYKVGDALGVLAENPPHIVDDLIAVQGWDPEMTVTTHNGERSLYDALKKDFEVHMANKKFVQSLAEKVVSSGMKISMSIVSRTRNESSWSANEDQQAPPSLKPSVPTDDPAAQVEAITSDTKAIEDYLWTRDYIDIMREFDVKYTPEEFFELAGRLKPRLYSIASSHDAHPGFVELTVGIVRFEYNGRARGGLCTQFMADEIDTSGAPIGVFMSPTKSFVLPDDKDIDIIMVGPGTGIAPFRAFMEQRVHDGGGGKNWLFFGDQSEKTEFYYKDEIESWIDGGHLYRFTTAWSRDQEEKIYVQHRLKEHGAEIWEWFERGAYFYICGDKTYMAKDVHRALIQIAIDHGGMSEEDATHFIGDTMMKEQKRYLRDVY
ncbi:MAG TPA: sulfite reductase subunit alpha [Candidatus Poseidoniales archaeon]|nr:MAG TPA: sulfite reductase subunit alpha [Candidatus Poseidoniales archaeon]HII77951.1 sulfite reductase subunit alpha [Poseidonia sp.]|tara:strand:- start:6348 stop:7598 length:1251 start_codon:yes stop_codon:yes gene_type:complete